MRLRPVAAVALVALGFFALAAAARPAYAAGVGEKCNNDRECVVGSICSNQNVCVALSKKRSIIPFYFHQPGDSGYRHITALLYFHTWDKHADTRVQFPLFGWHRDQDTHETTTVIPWLFSSYTTSPSEKLFRIWPFVFMGVYRDGGGQASILPLFWWSKKAGHGWLVAPLLLSGGQRDDQRDITELVLGLVGYYRRHGNADTWRVLFPLFFDHKTPEAHTVVGPLTWARSSSDGHSASVIIPLWWRVHDDKSGYEHALLLPLIDYESEQHGHKQRLISLLAAWQRDDSYGLKQLLVYAPIIFHRSDTRRTVDVVPPIFTRWTTKDDGGGGLIAGPLVHVHDLNGSTTSLFPIYWRFHDRLHDATTHLLFPIAAFHHHSGAQGGFVGPFYEWSSSNGAGGWGAGVAPILLFGRSGTRRHALVLPVFAHFSDSRLGTSTTAIGPLFWRNTPDGGDGGLFPLLFAGRHATELRGGAGPVRPQERRARLHRGRRPHLRRARAGQLGRGRGAARLLRPRRHALASGRSSRSCGTSPTRRRAAIGSSSAPSCTAATATRPPTRSSRSSTCAARPGAASASGPSAPGAAPTACRPPSSACSSTSRTSARTRRRTCCSRCCRCTTRRTTRCACSSRSSGACATATRPTPRCSRSTSAAARPCAAGTASSRCSSTRGTRRRRRPSSGRCGTARAHDGGRTAGLLPLFGWGKKVGRDGKSSSWFGMPGVYVDHNEFAGTSHTWALDFYHVTAPTATAPGSSRWRSPGARARRRRC